MVSCPQELQKALDAVRVSRPRRGKLYVDSYVKAWYFEEEGLMRWIADNYESYHARHMTALVRGALGARDGVKKKRLRELLAQVAALYERPT